MCLKVWKWKPSNSGTLRLALLQAISIVLGSSRRPSDLKHTKHFIPHSVPQTHIRKNVPSGMKPMERNPIQKPKPCSKRYKGIKKRLIGRMLITLTKAEIKGRDDRPCQKISLSIHIGDKTI